MTFEELKSWRDGLQPGDSAYIVSRSAVLSTGTVTRFILDRITPRQFVFKPTARGRPAPRFRRDTGGGVGQPGLILPRSDPRVSEALEGAKRYAATKEAEILLRDASTEMIFQVVKLLRASQGPLREETP
jgi:hypothetical protein